LSQRFWCPGLGFNEQSFGANEQVLEQGQSDKEPYCAARPRHQHEETNTISLRFLLLRPLSLSHCHPSLMLSAALAVVLGFVVRMESVSRGIGSNQSAGLMVLAASASG